ncbi:MAG: efflux RND transporter periplasmic adaptor subunit [Paracoccaceae bacterium]
MSAWKQIILSVAVVGLIGVLWFGFFPGAREMVRQQGFYKAMSFGAAQPDSTKDAAKPAETGASGSGGGKGRGGRITSVVVKPAVNETINTRIAALGTGVAQHSVTVLPSASGRLTAVPVQAGQEVKVGDVLAQLDATSQTIAHDKAQLALDDAKASLARSQALVRSKSISETQLQQAQLAVDNVSLGLRSAQDDLQNRSIIAPIEGTVGLVQVSVGNEITASSVITTIEDDSAILVNFWLPEVLMGSVQIGDPALAVLVARPDATFPAQVVGIDNKVDSASGTYEVQARLENAGRRLRPGMSFSVTMEFPGETHVAVDPLSILWGSDGAYVWRLVDDKVQKIQVRVIQRNSETVLVSGAMAAGDLIVIEGLEGLTPGAKARILDQTQDPPPTAGGN